MATLFQIALQEAMDSLSNSRRGGQTVSYGTGRGVVNDKKIRDAIENHNVAIIRYKSEEDKEGNHIKKRAIIPVAYGKSKAGNDVVRAFQQIGDTNTFSPHWKFFRVDRMLGWQSMPSTNFDTSQLSLYNSEGDDLMSQIYVQATKGKKRKNGKGSVTRSEKKTDDNVTVQPVLPKGEKSSISATPITKSDVETQNSPTISQKNIDKQQAVNYSNLKGDSAQMFNNNDAPITKAEIEPTQDNTNTIQQSQEDSTNNAVQMTVDNGYFSKTDIENGGKNLPSSSQNNDEEDEDMVYQAQISEMRRWNQILGNIPDDEE